MESSRALPDGWRSRAAPALALPGARFVSAGFVVAFVAVCLAGLAQALAASPSAFPRERVGLVALLAGSYALLGTLGLFVLEQRGASAGWLRLTLAALGALGAAATLLSHGYAAMLLLALVSTSVLVLSFSASVLVSVGAGVIAFVAFTARGSVWSALLQAEIAFGSGIAFVFVFSRIALRERSARAELMRVTHALAQANSALEAHAARVEELATTTERNRIAREIHDGLGHTLTVVHVQLEAALTLLASQPERARAAIAKAQQQAHQGLDEVRRSVALLRDGAIPHPTLIEALTRLTDESAHAGVPAHVTLAGSPRRLPEPVEFTLYRVAQEALTNAQRHAHASRISIRLGFEAAQVRLCVADDGVGAAEPAPGFGLIGLRERAELIGGRLSIQSEPQRGFRVELTVPG